MPGPSALAMALGVVAIGANFFLTSLVCNEITSAWNDLDSELREIQGILRSVSETVEKEGPKGRVVREDGTLDGESSIKSARIARRRLLNQLRQRNAPVYEIDGDSNEASSSEYDYDSTAPKKTTCDCKSFKNNCPVGPPGKKGKKGTKGLNGPTGRKGYPGLPGPSLHKHIHIIKNCALCAAGPRGFAGKVGPQGAPGPAGPSGASGAAGHPSPKGEPGPPGVEGPQGVEGKAGPAGVDGMPAEKLTPTKGEKGSRGSQGLQGPSGDMGSMGPPGVVNTIIGEPGLVGSQGRPGRTGQPGSVGVTGSEGEKVCECFVYLQQEEPNEPGHFFPVVEARRADIRRAPLLPQTPSDQPVASQIYVEKVGDDVTAKNRKTLFYYNQSGVVNLSIAKGQSVAPPFVKGSTTVVPPFVGRNPPVVFGFTTSTTTEEPQRFRYLSDEEIASIPANIFAKRRRLQGTRTFKSARAFAIENDLLGIEKPKKNVSDQKKPQGISKKKPLLTRKWGRFTRVFRAHKGPFLPLTRSSHISAHIARSRRKRPLPPGPTMWNNSDTNVKRQ